MGTMRRLRLPGSPESGHNGGRSTINFSDLHTGCEYPFLDYMKQGNRWTVYGGSGSEINVDPFSIDENGYPIYITAGGIGHITNMFIPTQVERPGWLVVDWIGNGEVFFGGMTFEYHPDYDASDCVSVTGQGKVKWKPTVTNNGFINFIGIKGIGSPRITKMRFYHEDDEELIGPIDNPSGEIFSPKLLQRLTETRPGILRFLSWPDNNKTNVTTWRTRKPVDYISYAADEFRGECFCDPTGNSLSGVTYSFEEPDVDGSTGEAWELQHGALAHVKITDLVVETSLSGTFTNANSSVACSGHAVTVGRRMRVKSVIGQGFPTNFTSGEAYWVVEVPDSSHVKLSQFEGGTAITPNASGNITLEPLVATRRASVVDGSDTLTLASHRLVLDQQVWVDRSDVTPLSAGFDALATPFFVCAVPNANEFKLSATQGGAAITIDLPNPHTSGTMDISPAIFFNIGDTGDIIVRSQYGNGISSGGNSYTEVGFRCYATVIYDGTLNAWIKHGGDIAASSTGIVNGPPPEIQLELCRKISAHYHALSPMYSMDPMTDYMPEVMALCRDTMPSWHIPTFEPPNETWNTAAGFYNGVFAYIKAYYNWGVFSFHEEYGKWTSTLGQAAATCFGIIEANAKTQNKYHIFLGVQTGTGDSEVGCAGSDPRILSPEYVNQAAPAQSGYTKTPAKNWVTRVGVAQYFTPSETGTSQELTWSNAYAACEVMATISGTDFHVDSVAFGSVASLKTLYGAMIPEGVTIISGADDDWVLSEDLGEIMSQRIMLGNMYLGVHDDFALTSNTGDGPFTVDRVDDYYANWKAWAISHDIPGMRGYEGGYSPDFSRNSSISGSTPLDQFRAATKLSAHLEGFVLDNLNNFVAHTEPGFIADFPASYYGGTMPCSAAWPIIDNIYALIPQPSYDAVCAFNNP